MSNAADLTASSISGQVFPLHTRSLMVFLVTLAITATTISFASFDVRGGNKEEKGGKDGTKATALAVLNVFPLRSDLYVNYPTNSVTYDTEIRM